LLDEYVKNRDVWRCPSAKLYGGASWIIPVQDWFTYIKGLEGSYGVTAGWEWMTCSATWPNGWGGDVTDTWAQKRLAVPSAGELGDAANKAFVQSIATSENYGLKLVSVNDPVSYVICGDGGAQTKAIAVPTIAYPDLCGLQCANSQCGYYDWEAPGCVSTAADCGLYNHATNDGAFLFDPNLRKPFSRHLGGVNLGFLDGHASWISSELVLTRLRDNELSGVASWGPDSTCGFPDDYPGVPTIF
jgi:prepilin-type processing-associated H-X9-DG protein